MTELKSNQAVVCFIAADGRNSFATVNGSKYVANGEFNARKFENDNNAKVIAVFDPADNFVKSLKDEEYEFNRLCGIYGFQPGDYRRKVEGDGALDRFLLIGFIPKNRRYKVRLYDRIRQVNIKASVQYVKAHII